MRLSRGTLSDAWRRMWEKLLTVGTAIEDERGASGGAPVCGGGAALERGGLRRVRLRIMLRRVAQAAAPDPTLRGLCTPSTFPLDAGCRAVRRASRSRPGLPTGRRARVGGASAGSAAESLADCGGLMLDCSIS
jgi:hypothetical protein